jgi:hypothetical protein
MSFFKDYLTYTEGISEAPEAFHWATSLILVSHLIGRKRWIKNPLPLYPNLYIALVGESGTTRKTTAIRLARDCLQTLFDGDPTPEIKWIPGLSSFEGFAEELKEQEEAHQTANFIITLEELASLLLKARQESTQNLISGLTELYDCGPVHRRTKKVNFHVERPFPSILAGSTEEWLFEYMRKQDVMGGFGNRFLYIYAKSSKSMPFPNEPNQRLKNKVVHSLNELRSALNGTPTPLTISPNAIETFAHFYEIYQQELKSKSEGSFVLKRLDEHVKKISMIYAVGDLSTEINEEHMNYACDMGLQILRWTKNLFRSFGDNLELKLENRILGLLEEKPMTRRELQQRARLHEKITATTFGKVLLSMLKIGVLHQITVDSQQVYQKTTP